MYPDRADLKSVIITLGLSCLTGLVFYYSFVFTFLQEFSLNVFNEILSEINV